MTQSTPKARHTAATSSTGETRILAEDKRADIDNAIENPRTGDLEAYSVDYLTRSWTGLDPKAAKDIAILDRAAKGQWSVVSQSDDDRLWTVALAADLCRCDQGSAAGRPGGE